MRRLPLALTAVGVVLMALVGCGVLPNGDPGGAAPAPSASPGLSGEIMVFAAASLTGTFTTLGETFEAANPGASITFSFGPSSGLATQITEGAPADVFASASQKNMDAVVDAGGADEPTVFAQNAMEIAVPADNPAHITALTDLARPAVKVALCQPDVPCGAVAASVFANAGITVSPITLEADAKATLTKVRLGEVDAGVVYVTDVLAAGDDVVGVAIPADVNAGTRYPIATLSASRSPELARSFVAYVMSAEGTSVLSAAGFLAP
ncbi:molybdate ABC transporter substrate-binding protein [Pengzhenrongella frigida]|uniref:Molybdate ABC transporter substrate-binding protein n=1 Tax=Pengzhenrongella frigida TaxID=1259133 RepID=A0A4Q5MZZ4_9MICO|nr:molybdate ABC transporter substrate-binding protein [Cellulomonas sp. HLT2-17]RYV51316.1 molybdate ABC transporter substrate-binding protein [Cellulomonas sp. HLT2-17]